MVAKVDAPALLPLLRSRIQGDLLALLYLRPDLEVTVSEAARRTGASFPAVQHEITRLVTAGLLTDRRQGSSRLVRAATHSRLSAPLTELLALTYGPLPVLTEALAPLEGVQRGFIYGSWAARYSGEPGPPPHDVDVLVVGTHDLDELDDVAHAAQQRLHQEVNITRVRPGTWDQPDPQDGFMTSLRSRPLLELDLAGMRAA